MQRDATNARILKLSGQLTLQDSTEPVILNLSYIVYVDSAGLGSLLGMLVFCQRKRRGFAIVSVAERVRTLFQVTHIDQLLPTFDTAEQAEQTFV